MLTRARPDWVLDHWNNDHGVVISQLISELMFVVVSGSHRLLVSPENHVSISQLLLICLQQVHHG